ncbi:ubiquitin-related modifier 1 [Klebsormidium nitens]|uniref:Ubiquitin-related modifier 1 homolog n=1 Tax=Klebsormidium nitens TaxID=105231 RepID=A0A1Y1HN13_KLENI|nr:ubiquitin-related modifier 1 [Klebsormidium nitens]|eukprot:GAQ78381.1 ubiquitin-related modifier 1 [Klebsormidium nitens]
MVEINLEFSGGLELLFGDVKQHKVQVPAKDGAIQVLISDLLVWIRGNLLKERPEMFLKGDSVRPGILVLINDCDWELCGRLASPVEDGDTVVFISTLHGG